MRNTADKKGGFRGREDGRLGGRWSAGETGVSKGARRITHTVNTNGKRKIGKIMNFIVLVRPNVMALYWEWKGVLDGLNFSDDIAVSLKIMFYGERFPILKTFKNTLVVHVLISVGDFHLITFLEKKVDCSP